VLKKPKVSIIIPVYNGSNYLKEAIDSALAQDYKNIEIIVINDGSNDDGKTRKVVESYGKKIIYKEKENGGVSTALNLGISMMTGEYFSWLSHDDRYKANKLSMQIKYLNDNNLLDKNVILYSDFDAIDKNSKFLWKEEKNHDVLNEKKEYVLLHGAINGITLLIPKKAFDECGVFDTKLRCTQDYELWYKMSKKYDFIHMKEVLADSRFHPKQVTNKSPLVVKEGNALWTKILKELSKKDMIRLEGSEYAFYNEILEFFKDSSYDETINYCKERIESIKKNDKYKKDIEDYEKRKANTKVEVKQSYNTNKNIFSKIFMSIHTVGFKITIKRIFNKLRK